MATKIKTTGTQEGDIAAGLIKDGAYVEPTKTEVPGVGTLTVSSKTTPVVTGAGAASDNTGLYERTGVTPPAPLTVTPAQPTNANNGVYKDANNNVFKADGTPVDQATFQSMGLNIDHINLKGADVPKYGSTQESKSAIQKAYDELSTQLDGITQQIISSKNPSEEEKQLAQDLAAKKAALASFDTESMKKIENYSGQGRGQTQQFVALNQEKERRTAALERLGISQDVANLVDLLGISKDERAAQGDIAMAQYDLATKRLDMSLGIQKEMERLDDKEKDNARSYLLDVINFAQGKTFDKLDTNTQAQIIGAVANSPITLDMVKNALKNGADELNGTGPKAPKIPINKLTISEADSLGLPRSLVGKDEMTVLNEMAAPTPPAWFKQIAEDKAQSSLTPQALEPLWKAFQKSFNTGGKTSSGSSGNSSGTDYGAFNLPPPVE